MRRAEDLPSIRSPQEEKLPLWPIRARGTHGGYEGRWRRNSGEAFPTKEVDFACEKTVIFGETRTFILGEGSLTEAKSKR